MQPRFSLEYFDPPEALRRHILVLFHFATDDPLFSDLQPGGLGQLVLFAQGEGEMHFAGHTDPVRGKAYLMSGFSRAARFEMRGPWRTIGASLSPLGWAALTGSPARDHVDRFLPASQLVGGDVEQFAGQLGAQYLAGQLGGEAACNALADWIAPRLGQIPAVHEKLIETTIHWLGGAICPDLDLLFPQLPYSRRQSERLVERYFGLPPAALARKFRAIRAAAILSRDVLSGAEEAVLADAFHDQPHMVREIKRFCGYTPSRLGGAGQPIMKTLLQLKNFERLREFRAL